jgi:hypothetical protein
MYDQSMGRMIVCMEGERGEGKWGDGRKEK